MLGIEDHKLYYKSYKEFMYMHPDLKTLEKELQDNRYKHNEEKRADRIKMATEKRAELIKNGSLGISKEKTKTLDESHSLLNPSSTAIREEQKRLERLKNKQIWELQNMIDFEFMMEETRRKNEEKLRLQREKEEKVKTEKLQKTAEISKKRLMKEMERDKRLKEENEEQSKRMKEREEQENKKRAEEMRRRETEEKEQHKRQIEAKKKEDEFRKQIESIFEGQQQELVMKQKELLEKEEIRKRNLEASRHEKLLKAMKNSEKSKFKIDKTLNKNEEKMRKHKEVIIHYWIIQYSKFINYLGFWNSTKTSWRS